MKMLLEELFCTMLLNIHEKETNFMYFRVLFEIMISKCLKFRNCSVLNMSEFNINLDSFVGSFSFQFLVGTNPSRRILFSNTYVFFHYDSEPSKIQATIEKCVGGHLILDIISVISNTSFKREKEKYSKTFL